MRRIYLLPVFILVNTELSFTWASAKDTGGTWLEKGLSSPVSFMLDDSNLQCSAASGLEFQVDSAMFQCLTRSSSLMITPRWRSEERRVGTECDISCRSRGAPYH